MRICESKLKELSSGFTVKWTKKRALAVIETWLSGGYCTI